VLTAEAIEPMARNQELIEIAYREGKVDLPTALLLQTQLLDADLSFIDAQLAERLAAAELSRALGDSSAEPGG
jgi:outer membrane protein TolC